METKQTPQQQRRTVKVEVEINDDLDKTQYKEPVKPSVTTATYNENKTRSDDSQYNKRQRNIGP